MSEIKTNKISPRKGTTQTIGDSGDTLSIACGVTVTNAGNISTVGITGGTIDNQGTITGLAGVINWDTTAKTSGFTAVSNTGYFCNTTSSTFTVTLPASPSAGDVIGFKDYANTFDTNKLSIDSNGNNIQGSSSTFQCTDEGAALQFIYVDATRGWVLTDASKASDIAEQILYVTATGGTESYCGDYKIHTFTGPGTFCVSCAGNSQGSNTVDYLVIAGGGAGAGKAQYTGGGGGAGGYRTNYPSGCAGISLTVQGYPITVGGGGSAPPTFANGNPGSDSIFSTITSAGGAGGSFYAAGLAGGSGGGAGSAPCGPRVGGAGNTPPVSPPQGNNGGGAWAFNVGGGGGAGGVGGSGNGSPGTTTAGPGGAGLANSITGSSVTRSGGGGGGGTSWVWLANPGPGGSGGGGNGGMGYVPGTPNGTAATAGTTNTGSGGGGSGFGSPAPTNPGLGGAGGSGIVIIRYKYQ